MRTAPRYYLIADDGTIHRLARATFYDILMQKKPTPFPELRGQRVKLATIYVALDGRRAVAVARAQFNFITFDSDGLFDSTEWDEASERTIEAWTIPKIDEPTPVIDARARFAARRNEIEQTWIPSDELRDQLFATAVAKRATSH
ncbi:MAG: hypothetical protein JO093_18830 [Acidobacteria bacterium]|nr:hypothetical protein [Acidobacteriota bacterium]MBV9069435.1 hypothetical protein [Acidobacteriota bacterium]MBV9187679.1 hypothetical protein [Acidobacteriota bacterium]